MKTIFDFKDKTGVTSIGGLSTHLHLFDIAHERLQLYKRFNRLDSYFYSIWPEPSMSPRRIENIIY
jgi:hypothetical protein